jgi:Zn-finger domain-containing protein
MKDRLSTRNLLKRKNMFLEDYNCAICVDSTEETLLHLFLDCPFAMECCETLGSTVQHFDDPFQTISSFRIQLVVPFSMEIITSMCWPFGLSEMIQSSEMFSHPSSASLQS